MSFITTPEALEGRKAEAHEATRQFDFQDEASLATFWRQATPGTAYWRGYLPMKALPGQLIPIEHDSLAEADDKSLILNRQVGDTAIWQFLGDDGRSRIALQMRRQGLRTLMEVDDTYLKFAPPLYGKAGAWTRTHAEAVANGTGYSVEMHRKVVPQMDGIIVSTPYLADLYDEYNDHVYICPNSVDPSDWNVERTESDVLRIGYYGSPSHLRDWPRVKKAMKWAVRQKDVEVITVGFRPPGWTGKALPWNDRILEGRAGLGQLDVGIAPLTQNAWANGKSDLKAVEYAMAGVLPVVEDSPPYAPWVDMGWPYCPGTPDEWDDVIKDIVQNRDRVKAQAAEAKAYVLAERTIEKNIHAWREAVVGG